MSITGSQAPARKRLGRWLGLGVLVVAVLALVFWVGGIAYAGIDLLRVAREGQAMLQAGSAGLDAELASELLADARRDTVLLNRRLNWLAPVAPHLTWIPRIGPLLGQAPALLELGDSLTALGVLLWDDAAPALKAQQQGAPLSSVLPELVAHVGVGLQAKQELAERAEASYARLDVAAFPDRLQGPVNKLGEVLPLLNLGLQVADRAPALLGLDSPATYLVLVLNEDELRPGGGFLTAVAEISVVDGDIAGMVFQDSYAVDDFTQPYPYAPDPLRELMGIEPWVFRDSNWSPDFPSAARQAIELYRPGYTVEVDGVIGVDQQAVMRLIEAVEPLSMPGQNQPVTGETVLSYMYGAWRPEDGVIDAAWWSQRKSFMGELAGAAIGKVKSGDADYLRLVEAALTVLGERHLQLSLADVETAGLLAEKGWDGGMPSPQREGDLLAVVEANVGYNKASARIGRHLVYEVDLGGTRPVARVGLRYENQNPASEPCQPAIRYETEYQTMMDRCYWAYVRVYAPEGSLLKEASRHPIPAELVLTEQAWAGEAQAQDEEGYAVFSQAFLLPRAEEALVEFSYNLPPDVVQTSSSGVSTYRLLVRKQAGLDVLDANISLRLPENAVVLSARPDFVQGEDGVFSYQSTSQTDIEIVLEYQLPRE